MIYRRLGGTWLRISAVAFGAGPVSGWMDDPVAERQLTVVRRAIDAGVNWFDTAAGYGEGRSEEALGKALARLGVVDRVHVATKVRLQPNQLGHIAEAVRDSLTLSLQRLRLRQVTLLQLHNAITLRRDDEPFSITPRDVLGPGGVAEALHRLKSAGHTACIGLTGTGHPDALREVVRSGLFDTIQAPYHLLNPTAGHHLPTFPEANYGHVFADCAALRMGVFAIRIFAGGALLGKPPSPHTHRTPFFPLALYQRDLQRAEKVRAALGPEHPLPAAAIRFALSHPQVSSALIGFGQPEEVDQAVGVECFDPLPEDAIHRAIRAASSP